MDHPGVLECRISDDLSALPAAEWDALGGRDEPFLSHAFLCALERHDCLGSRFGWYPRHVTLHQPGGELVAALPLYIKTNNYGEFVFDWAWEQAWRQSGLNYYPKLVCSIPYTPATGTRLLVHPDHDRKALQQVLIQQAIELTHAGELSGLHVLFPEHEDSRALQAAGLTLRMGCQYHWHNENYRDFDDFIERFSAKKRKNVRRERRRVQEQGLDIRVLHGDEVSRDLWAVFHHFYVSTFERKMGIPTLSLGFFQETGRTLGRQVVMFLVEEDGEPVAAALCYRGKDTLYGRYWGCIRDYDALHFEACYYQGIDYCIQQGLARFEPGAQGEHKISRGFLPTRTWSGHWITHPGLRGAVAAFCQREQAAMAIQCEQLMRLSPFRVEAESGSG
ncbi:hypothetical protein ECTPHS_10114 [Ectothiorhodospira sp. PHS-1]|uniref:GNAT family N-acetyltransferase n=1 Tax=Ectothiorhodospira sp. PHS-1 TaxID=519989 RepID=UPI00024A89CE|nr:GNAT family N-acetyltransferase [Ectothiorhodospira sp. PHS-1]EHQ53034.1 hypothetical protein ECTPHS_10114 [Ectothiorhodospira sp. PHS-1]